MHVDAMPSRLVAVTDGVHEGQEHVVVFLKHLDREEVRGFAFSLSDARKLLAALALILPGAQEIQDELTQTN
jgi:hypothetical protein